MRPLRQPGPHTRHWVAVLCCCWVVSHGHQRRRAALGCTSVATAAASACGGKTEPADPSDDGLGASGAQLAGGGLGLPGAPRPGRPALSAQASAGRPARRSCSCTCSSGRGRTRLRSPSARRARTRCSGCPRGPSGPSTARRTAREAVLGVFLGPAGARGHAEPAGVAVLALPSVGVAILIIGEHVAAEDTDAVVGVPIPYDRRHATSGRLTSVPCHLTNRIVGDLVPSGFESRAREWLVNLRASGNACTRLTTV